MNPLDRLLTAPFEVADAITLIAILCLVVPLGVTIWQDYKAGVRALEKRMYDDDAPWK